MVEESVGRGRVPQRSEVLEKPALLSSVEARCTHEICILLPSSIIPGCQSNAAWASRKHTRRLLCPTPLAGSTEGLPGPSASAKLSDSFPTELYTCCARRPAPGLALCSASAIAQASEAGPSPTPVRPDVSQPPVIGVTRTDPEDRTRSSSDPCGKMRSGAKSHSEKSDR